MLKFFISLCQIMLKTVQFKRLLKRKLCTAALIAASGIAAFATLGDGKKTSSKSHKLLSYTSYNSRGFSLKSGYSYSGDKILDNTEDSRYMMLNTTVTYQQGHTTYILPLKKRVILDKVKFNPQPSRY